MGDFHNEEVSFAKRLQKKLSHGALVLSMKKVVTKPLKHDDATKANRKLVAKTFVALNQPRRLLASTVRL